MVGLISPRSEIKDVCSTLIQSVFLGDLLTRLDNNYGAWPLENMLTCRSCASANRCLYFLRISQFTILFGKNNNHFVNWRMILEQGKWKIYHLSALILYFCGDWWAGFTISLWHLMLISMIFLFLLTILTLTFLSFVYLLSHHAGFYCLWPTLRYCHRVFCKILNRPVLPHHSLQRSSWSISTWFSLCEHGTPNWWLIRPQQLCCMFQCSNARIIQRSSIWGKVISHHSAHLVCRIIELLIFNYHVFNVHWCFQQCVPALLYQQAHFINFSSLFEYSLSARDQCSMYIFVRFPHHRDGHLGIPICD